MFRSNDTLDSFPTGCVSTGPREENDRRRNGLQRFRGFKR